MAAHPVRIAPSLLAADFAHLAREIAEVEKGGADWLHLDVMDGHFVPNLTFGPPVVAAMARVATLPLDVHLMIEDPWTYAEPFLDAGTDRFTFHVEVAGRGDVGALIEVVRRRDVAVGISLNPDIDVADLAPYLGDVDQVLVMSVFAGFGGQSFMPEVLEKVRTLRGSMGFQGIIAIDGGIGPETIAQAAAAGADVFVAGTAVFGQEDRAGAIADLRARAQSARSS